MAKTTEDLSCNKLVFTFNYAGHALVTTSFFMVIKELGRTLLFLIQVYPHGHGYECKSSFSMYNTCYLISNMYLSLESCAFDVARGLTELPVSVYH